MPKFSIAANGYNYVDCWENIDIKMSMGNVCNEISVSTLNFFENKLVLFRASNDWKLKKGASYICRINDEFISIGYIDDVGVQYSGEGSSIDFYMRDKTSDIVDCPYYSENKNEFKKQSLADITKALCLPFNILVKIDSSASEALNLKLDSFTVDQGRSVAEQIVEECTKVGVLVTTDGLGNLLLTQPTLTDISSDLITDTNILHAEMGSTLKDRFSNYIVKAEIKPDKLVNVDSEQEWIEREKEGSYSNRKKVEDKELSNRYRPFIMLSDTAQTIEDCVKRAVYEANIRRAKSLRVNYTLEGWTEVNSGKVWRPNRLVQVNDRVLDINETMLVNSVNLVYSSDSGFQTTLELVLKECYSLNEQALQLIRKGF